MSKMTEEELKSLVKQGIEESTGYLDDEITDERVDALARYNAEPYGDEISGRSQVVSTDVRDMIESLMPTLMEIFAGQDHVGAFEPVGIEDEASAEQATDYIHSIVWNGDNNSYLNTFDWIKDALIQKVGIAKDYWDDTPVQKRETLTGLNSLDLQTLQADESLEIVELTERPATEEELPYVPDGVLYDVVLMRTTLNGRIRCTTLPPEEFLVAKRCISLEGDDFRFACHRKKVTRSSLVEEGFDKDTVDAIPAEEDSGFDVERQTRFNRDDQSNGWQSKDPAMQEVMRYECYIRADCDGDGIASIYQVIALGTAYELVSKKGEDYYTEVDDHPFTVITPVRIPHKLIGMSYVDLISAIQKIKTAIERQVLDNMYQKNNARAAISNKVNLDDYLTNRPGGAVRIDTDTADVNGHIVPMQSDSILRDALPVIEYFDKDSELRSGVTRNWQGMDPKAFDSTATGINLMLGRAQQRVLGLARLLAETGFKERFKKLLRLVINHQDRARTVRLRGKWVPVDPKSWNAMMDFSVSIGPAAGTMEQKSARAQQLLALQEKVIMFQQGINGPLVNLKEIHNGLTYAVNATGEKNAEKFFAQPPENWQPPQKQDPKMAEAQGKMQIEQAKAQGQMQLKQMELMGKQQLAQAEMQAKLKQAAMDYQLEMEKLGMEDAHERARQWHDIMAATMSQQVDMAVAKAGLQMDAVKLEDELSIKRAEAAGRYEIAKQSASNRSAAE